MQRQRDELVPIGDALADLPGPVQAIREASPQALHHFTQADQVNQLVAASEADADLGFMARMMVLCSLPRTNPGNRHRYVRRNGPYTLIMYSSGETKLPFGNFPRLILAWVCTEAVRTQSRELVLGRSLAKFMKTLGVYTTSGETQTRLRNQIKRLFGCTVSLIYKDENVNATVNAVIADHTVFWWNERKPDQPSLWDSKIELSEKFFNEIIRCPVPLDLNALTALKRCSLGLDLYLWLTYRTFTLRAPLRLTWQQFVPPVWPESKQRDHSQCRPKLSPPHPPRVDQGQASLAETELFDSQGPSDPASLDTSHRAAQSKPASELISSLPASQRPVSGF